MYQQQLDLVNLRTYVFRGKSRQARQYRDLKALVERHEKEYAYILKNEENEDSDPETPSKRSRLYNEGENVDSQTHKLFWACFEESAIEQPEPTEKQSKNATAQEIAKYTALAKADRKINPYEWWALSTNKNGFPILSKLAKRYLITPASSVYSERLFTEAGLLYEKKRNRLAPERAEKIVFLHHNLPLVDFKY
ncbi:Zinc finger BED domain-containing protein 4 [Eumeta japonica]|uniref:Zinc finger BED domain-containing protein 4 n=1 Tax=Eumeta variegata TaxID=151549 RepID=A0A4C1SQH3_EUMVA|nr:Zinc finger BED domain-containing protein 4 [Eumeta japonica]